MVNKFTGTLIFGIGLVALALAIADIAHYATLSKFALAGIVIYNVFFIVGILIFRGKLIKRKHPVASSNHLGMSVAIILGIASAFPCDY